MPTNRIVRKIFGTDGIRGVANKYPITPEFALKLGRAASMIFRKLDGSTRHKKIIIGKDTRVSCYMLEDALAAGISSMGVDVYLLGPMPTPAIAFLTVSMRAEAGIVISASHNPFEDNGIKFFSGTGYKLPDAVEEQIEAALLDDAIDDHRPTAADIGKAFRIEDAQGRYIVFAKSTFPKELTLEGLSVVVDCANGATYRVAPAIFEELGATVYPISNKPNGTNINANCGALHPDNLARTVRLKKADLGPRHEEERDARKEHPGRDGDE
jgi:phosphoglucosamine mutase